jgi:hypothetical protein
MEGLVGEVKTLLDTQNVELSKHGKTSKETKSALDVACEKWDKGEKALSEKVAAFEAKYTEIEKRLSRGSFGIGASNDKGRKTIGRFLVESQQFQAVQDSKTYRMPPMKVDLEKVSLEKKELVHSTSEVGALIDPFRWQEIVAPQLAMPRLAQMIPMVPVSVDKVEYVEEVVTNEMWAELEAQAATAQADMTIARSAEGFYPGQTLTIAQGTGPEETKIVDSVDYDTRVVTLTTNLANTHAIGVEVTSDTFVFTPYTKVKPLAKLEFELQEADIRTLATIVPIAKQMMDDIPRLQNYVDSRLREFLANQRERQYLYGNGGTREINGIMTNPNINTYKWSDGVPGDTELDAIRRAITLASLAHYPPDMVVLHPSQMEAIELAKGTDGHYLFAQAQTANGVTMVWRVQVVESTFIDEGWGLTGSFRLGYVVWDRQDVNLSISDQNRDWWERNIIGLRLEERLGSSVIRPKAFTSIEFDAAPSP